MKNFKKDRPIRKGRKVYPGEEMLDENGKYSVQDTRGKSKRLNKLDWPRFLIHNYAGRP